MTTVERWGKEQKEEIDNKTVQTAAELGDSGNGANKCQLSDCVCIHANLLGAYSSLTVISANDVDSRDIYPRKTIIKLDN